MPPTLFISDLHLSPERPALVAAFDAFCARPGARGRGACTCSATSSTPGSATTSCAIRSRRGVAAALRALAAAGVPRRRDARQPRLPAGRALRARRRRDAAARRRSSSTSHGTPTLLLHGDELCTDDAEYQRYRAWARDPRAAAALPGAALFRCGAASPRGCARKSRAATAAKPEAIMDVNAGAVAAALRAHGVDADDPRPHAPAGAPRARRRRRAPASAGCWPTGTTAASYLEVDASGRRMREVA